MASASPRCALSVLYESMGTDDPTAILAEVSIGEMKKAPLNPEVFGRITINNAEIHDQTRVWFIGHQRTAQFEGEEDYYNIAVGCFEDLDLFNRMIEIK